MIREDSPDAITSDAVVSYYVEISISRNRLTLYEKRGGAEKSPIAADSQPIRSESAG